MSQPTADPSGSSVPRVTAAGDGLATLADRAADLVRDGERAILGVTGSPGAGKSTLATAIVDAVEARRGAGWAAAVPMDGFHLADVQLRRLGLLDRKGAPETFDASGYASLLERLRRDDEVVVYAPGFERDLEQPIAAALAVPSQARLIVTEGNYLLLPEADWPRARACLDEAWYCVLDETERLRRLVDRHVRFGKTPAAAQAWVLRSDEANARRIEQTADSADLLVDTARVGDTAS